MFLFLDVHCSLPHGTQFMDWMALWLTGNWKTTWGESCSESSLFWWVGDQCVHIMCFILGSPPHTHLHTETISLSPFRKCVVHPEEWKWPALTLLSCQTSHFFNPLCVLSFNSPSIHRHSLRRSSKKHASVLCEKRKMAHGHLRKT